jgi:hypothetical protein
MMWFHFCPLHTRMICSPWASNFPCLFLSVRWKYSEKSERIELCWRLKLRAEGFYAKNLLEIKIALYRKWNMILLNWLQCSFRGFSNCTRPAA